MGTPSFLPVFSRSTVMEGKMWLKMAKMTEDEESDYRVLYAEQDLYQI